MFVPNYMKLYNAMIPGMGYYTSEVPLGGSSFVDLCNTLFGWHWSEGIVNPLIKKGLITKTKTGPSINSPVCYVRIPKEDKENV